MSKNTDNLILRESTYSPLTTKGTPLDKEDFDDNFINVYKDFEALSVTNSVTAYAPETEYDDTENNFATYNGKLWQWVDGSAGSGVTPSDAASEWLEVQPTILAHVQNQDLWLDRYGKHPISASQLSFIFKRTLRGYGAAADGTTDDTAAIQSALDTGMPILDGEGLTYFISSELTISENTKLMNVNFVIDGSYTDDQLISSTGTLETADTPTADISEGDYSISVTDESIYSEGDYLFIKDDGYWSPVSLDDVKNGEVVRIKSTSTNTLNLETSAIVDYTSANSFTIEKINIVENIVLENISAVGIDSNLKFARFEYCKNVKVLNCRTNDFDNAHFSFNTCIDYTVDNCNLDGSGVQDGLNYGVIHVAACFNGKVTNCTGSNMRHLSSIGGSQGVSRFIDVISCTSIYMTDAGLDAHSAVLEHSFVNNNIVISPEADTTQDGIISQGAIPYISENRIFNARRHGINWQPLLSSSISRKIKCTIDSNEIDYAQRVTGTAYGILIVTPTNSTRSIDNLKISDNTITGSVLTSTVYIHADENQITNILVSNNDFNNVPSLRAIHFSSSGAIISNVTVIGNKFISGSNECVYIQGNATYAINDVMISSNIISGGTYGLRTNYVDVINTVGNMYLDFVSGNRLIQNTTNHTDLDT